MAKVRLGILGGGYWGKNVLRNFSSMEEVEVKVLCDPNPDSLQELRESFPSLELIDKPEALLRSDGIEGVAIVTPPSLHASPAKEALRSGKHVFVEKPMAMSLEEGEELVRMAEEGGRVLFVDETFLYDPALRTVKEMIRGGEIGEVYHLLLQRLGMGRIRCESNVWWNSAPHDLSILRYLLERPVRSISVKGYTYLQEGLQDMVWGDLELEDGVSAWVHLSWYHPISTASLVAVGSRGSIFYEGRFAKRKVALYRHQLGSPPKKMVGGIPSPNLIPARSHCEREITDFGPPEPLFASCEAFIKAVREGMDAPSLGRYSLETLKVLDAGARSLERGGERVRL